MNTERVQVATTILNEPIPGVLVTTDDGDIIFVFDIVTGTMGIHAPDDTPMNLLVDMIDEISRYYTLRDINPFILDDTVPLIVETDFIFRHLGG